MKDTEVIVDSQGREFIVSWVPCDFCQHYAKSTYIKELDKWTCGSCLSILIEILKEYDHKSKKE